MSERDVHRIICPIDRRERERLELYASQAERVIFALRRMLIATDPSLPDPHDGNAWHKIETTT